METTCFLVKNSQFRNLLINFVISPQNPSTSPTPRAPSSTGPSSSRSKLSSCGRGAPCRKPWTCKVCSWSLSLSHRQRAVRRSLCCCLLPLPLAGLRRQRIQQLIPLLLPPLPQQYQQSAQQHLRPHMLRWPPMPVRLRPRPLRVLSRRAPLREVRTRRRVVVCVVFVGVIVVVIVVTVSVLVIVVVRAGECELSVWLCPCCFCVLWRINSGCGQIATTEHPISSYPKQLQQT